MICESGDLPGEGEPTLRQQGGFPVGFALKRFHKKRFLHHAKSRPYSPLTLFGWGLLFFLISDRQSFRNT
jgi:hypothetical protein